MNAAAAKLDAVDAITRGQARPLFRVRCGRCNGVGAEVYVIPPAGLIFVGREPPAMGSISTIKANREDGRRVRRIEWPVYVLLSWADDPEDVSAWCDHHGALEVDAEEVKKNYSKNRSKRVADMRVSPASTD